MWRTRVGQHEVRYGRERYRCTGTLVLLETQRQCRCLVYIFTNLAVRWPYSVFIIYHKHMAVVLAFTLVPL